MKKIMLISAFLYTVLNASLSHLSFQENTNSDIKEFLQKSISSKVTKEELFIIKMYLIGFYTSLQHHSSNFGPSYCPAPAVVCMSNNLSRKKQHRISKIIKKINDYLHTVTNTNLDGIQQLRTIIECL